MVELDLKKKTLSKSNLSTQFDISAQAHFDKTFLLRLYPEENKKIKKPPHPLKNSAATNSERKEGKEETKK